MPSSLEHYRGAKEEDEVNIDEAVDAFYLIENGLLRREPTLSRWAGFHMANTDKRYFAYTIDGETITVRDACHAQNMHEDA